MSMNVVNEAMGASLRALRAVASSPILDRIGLRAPAERALYQGSKSAFQAAERAASRFGGKPKAGQSADRLARPGRPALFDLTPSDEQKLMQDTVRRLAEEVLAPAAAAADDACAPPDEVLAMAQELGLALMAVPESFEGAGETRSVVTNVLVAEELARGDMGLALAIMAPLTVIHALVDWGTPEQQAKYLPAFTGDDFVPAALALLEPTPLFDPHELTTGAVRRDGGWVLYGEKTMVPLAGRADLFLVAADVKGMGPRLFLVEGDTEGVVIEAAPTMGLRSAALGTLRFDGAKLSPDALLGGEDSRYDHGAAVDRARIGWSALAVGCAQAVLDYVIPYCNERQAFGEPISNRQSVAFLIADIKIEVDGMRLLTWRAAARAEQGVSHQKEAYLARLQCADKGMKIGTDGVQLLGGHGFVKDHPVERFYRHLRAVGVAEGNVLV